MTTKLKSVLVAVAGAILAVLPLALNRMLGPAGGALLIAAIVLEFVALVLLARDRREAARAIAAQGATREKRRAF